MGTNWSSSTTTRPTARRRWRPPAAPGSCRRRPSRRAGPARPGRCTTASPPPPRTGARAARRRRRRRTRRARPPGGRARPAGRAGLGGTGPRRARGPYERLAAVLATVAMMGTGAFTPRRRARPAGAFGPCLVTSRADLAAVGGHAAVAAEVLDDVALARRYLGRRATGVAGRAAGARSATACTRAGCASWSTAGARTWPPAPARRRLADPACSSSRGCRCCSRRRGGRSRRRRGGSPCTPPASAQLAWMWARIGRFGVATAAALPAAARHVPRGLRPLGRC